MTIFILAGKFPVLSETFVLHHVTGLLDRGVEVNVVANTKRDDVGANVGIEKYRLRERTWYYNLPRSKLRRVCGVLPIIVRNLMAFRWSIIASFNPVRFGKSALSLQLPYVVDAFLRAGPVDILHCHFGPVGVLGVHLKQLGLVNKLVVTFHGYDVSRVLQSSEQEHPYVPVFKQADLILAVSERWRLKLLELGAPSERTLVHRMGIDVDKFSYCKQLIGQGPMRLITTARFTEKKGLQYAVKAVRKLTDQHPDMKIRYDVIGDGLLRSEIEELVVSLGLSDQVVLHGALPHARVQEMLAEADVFLLPSVTATDGDQEGIPVSLMEAMAGGMPVVSTLHSGIPELVKDGVSGYLVPERDVEALANRLVYLAQNPNERKALGLAGRRTVEQDYNLIRQNDRLVKLYRDIL